MWVGTLWRFRPSGEAHPERVDLRAVLEEVPDAWSQLVPQVHQLPEATQSVEGGVGLDGKQQSEKDTWIRHLGDRSHPGTTPPGQQPVVGRPGTRTPPVSCLDVTSLIRRRAAGVSGV